MRHAIIRHEWRMLAADGSVFLVAAVFLLSIGYGLFNGARWVRFQQEAIQTARTEETTRFDTLRQQAADLAAKQVPVRGFGDPRNAGTAGRSLATRYAIMPPGPLAALAIGQSDLLPSYVSISTQSKEQTGGAGEIENPIRQLTGRFDLAFVVVYLYPLLILALTYNIVSAEKEHGTLALALAQPISLASIVLGKLAVRGALFLLIVVGLGIGGLLVARVELGAATVLARVALWIATIAAYGAFWFALALIVAGRGRSSATNALTLAGLWLAMVIVLPSLLNLFVTTRYPVPSRVAMIQSMREASDAATTEGSRLLGKYYEDHPELAGDATDRAMQDFSLTRMLVDDDVDRRVGPVVARYESQLARQTAWVERWRLLSPAIVVQDVMNDLAGAGAPRHRHFMSLVDRFHREWRAFFRARLLDARPFLALDTAPRFHFREQTFDLVVWRTLASLAAIVLPTVILAFFGVRALRRFPVLAIAIVLGASVGAFASAEENGRLMGRVTDQSGAAIPGATVRVTSIDARASADGRHRTIEQSTSADGGYDVGNLPPGEYELTIAARGFAMTRRPVSIQAARVNAQHVVLGVEGVREETTVSPRPSDAGGAGTRLGLTRRETPASVDTVTQATLQERGADTIAGAVRGVTGMTAAVRPGAAGVFSARGFTENSIGVLFSGVRVQSATVTMRTYDAFNFDRIEVLRGPASVLHGEGAAAGAVNFVRREPTGGPTRVEVLGTFGQADRIRAGAAATGSLGGRAAYVVSAARQQFDTHVESNEHDYNHLVAGLRFTPSRSVVLLVDADWLHNTIDDAYWGTPLVDGRVDEGLRGVNYNQSSNNRYSDDVRWVRGSAGWAPRAGIGYKGQVFRYDADRDWRNSYGFEIVPGDAAPLVRRRAVESLAYDHGVWGTRHEVTFDTRAGRVPMRTVAGVDISSTTFSSPRSYGARVTVDAWRPGSRDVDAPPRADDRRADVLQTALFAEHRVTLGARTTVIAGVRGGWLRADLARPASGVAFEKRFTPVDGRVGVVHALTPRLSAYGQFATGSEPVEALLILGPAERQFSLAHARQWEAGAVATLWAGRAELTAAFYDIVKRDLTSTDPNDAALTVQIGRQSSRGLEVSAQVSPGRAVTIEANVARLRARYNRFFEGAASRAGNLPPNVPETMANLGVTWRPIDRIDVGAWISAVGERTIDAANSVRVPAYALVEPFARVRLSSALDLTARLRNATDETCVEWATRAFGVTNVYFGEPRRFDVTLRARF